VNYETGNKWTERWTEDHKWRKALMFWLRALIGADFTRIKHASEIPLKLGYRKLCCEFLKWTEMIQV
jgi:hypothetical protein